MISEHVDPPTTMSEDDEIAECYIRMQGVLRELSDQLRQINARSAADFAEIKQILKHTGEPHKVKGREIDEALRPTDGEFKPYGSVELQASLVRKPSEDLPPDKGDYSEVSNPTSCLHVNECGVQGLASLTTVLPVDGRVVRCSEMFDPLLKRVSSEEYADSCFAGGKVGICDVVKMHRQLSMVTIETSLETTEVVLLEGVNKLSLFLCAPTEGVGEPCHNNMGVVEQMNINQLNIIIDPGGMINILIDTGVMIPHIGWKCAKCVKSDNLWLTLTDDTILCGRKKGDGTGGNNHTIEYYKETCYPLAVKLGIVTADLEGSDVFSYLEDGGVEDIIAQLVSMGFSYIPCQKAAIRTSNAGIVEAMNWLLSYMDDADIDIHGSAIMEAASSNIDELAVDTLISFGFQEEIVRKALREFVISKRQRIGFFSNPNATASSNGDAMTSESTCNASDAGLSDEGGRYRLKGFVSHIGTSIPPARQLYHTFLNATASSHGTTWK